MRTLLILFCLLIPYACAKQEHPLLIDDDKAVALLLDLNLASVALKKYPINFRDSVSSSYKSQICKFHNIPETELDTLLWQMQADYKRYNKLYLQLKDTLTKLETNIGNRNESKPLQNSRVLQEQLKNVDKEN